MRLQLKPSPFLPAIRDDLLTECTTVHAIIETCGDMAWAEECVAVHLNGMFIPRAWWKNITVKPEATGILEFVIVHQKGQLVPILASVALIALTAGIGTFGVPFLGAGFAAGTFGASALAAGVGIAGQIALRALTAPPSARGGAEQRGDLSQAGIQQNQITFFETLPTLDGMARVSPPIIAPFYTTITGGILTGHAIVGIQGPNTNTDVKINGTDIDRFEGVEYEVREGLQSDAPLTLCQLTCIQQQSNYELSNFDLRMEASLNDKLKHQDDPASDTPRYQSFKTDGIPDEIWIRFLFVNGIFRPSVGDEAFVPIRIEIRRVGDVAWRNLPTTHIRDIRPGSGSFRQEVKIKFQTQPSGRHFSNSGDEYPVVEVTNITGIGQSFEYQSDAYFQNTTYVSPGDDLPIMTAASTGGFTMSASSELAAGQAAWKAADNLGSGGWQPANNSLPAWHQTQVPSARTYRSYRFSLNGLGDDSLPTTMPLSWYVSASNDGVNFTRLDDEDVSIADFPLAKGTFQIGNPGSYLYYRINFLTNNGAANQQITVFDMDWHTFDAIGIAAGHDTAALNGMPARHTSGGDPRSVYASIDENGVTYYLDPAQWLNDAEYEVRIKRGTSNTTGNMVWTSYANGFGATGTDHFEYRTSGSLHTVAIGQRDFKTDTTIEIFSTVSNDVPVDVTGITCIAVEIKDTKIESISSLMQSYAPIRVNGIWDANMAPTSNPAALYRRRKLGHAHPNPQDGEILDEDELIDWYTRCDAAGYECNFLQQGRSIPAVLGVIAYTGFASPREANLSGVVQDFDRSPTGTDEEVSALLSPLNSRLISENIPAPEIEHCIIAEFLDEDDDYKVAREYVYRDGYSEQTATFFVTFNYEGLTNRADVIARAAFDIKQAIARANTTSVEVDIEGFNYWRGKLVGHNDEVLYDKHATALITAITTVGPNIVSITVDNPVPFAANQDDLDALMSGLDLANATHVGIRLEDGSVLVKSLTNTVDGNECIFTTPFTSAGSGVEVGQLAVFGIATTGPFARKIVIAVDMRGFEKRVLTLAPEAPEIFQ